MLRMTKKKKMTMTNREEILEWLFAYAATMLSTRQLTDFSQPRFVASGGRQKHGILVVPGMGD
jgi:hypothetical protein